MKDINSTVIVNLVPEEKKILENLNKDARWGIGRAKREGLVVKETDKEEDWKKFYELYKNTIKKGGADIVPMNELKKNTIAFFVCEKDNKIIAGAGLRLNGPYDKDIPRLYINASLNEYQKMQPNNLLYWECIIWSKKRGYKKLDLGGWQINARGHLKGINRFKEKWGEIVYYNKDYPLLKAIGRKLIRKSAFFWWLNKKMKGRK
jgi:lipid II:glycine glycyltransferase (peptidoglycan interpeptide bridge formation enzyme)